ncbi:hypothetical protein HmCmsJML188_00085 [Escherichia coli]|nr:hypothetical protein HmCmsJML188_00085 [Escherichia coli]
MSNFIPVSITTLFVTALHYKKVLRLTLAFAHM